MGEVKGCRNAKQKVKAEPASGQGLSRGSQTLRRGQHRWELKVGLSQKQQLSLKSMEKSADPFNKMGIIEPP